MERSLRFDLQHNLTCQFLRNSTFYHQVGSFFFSLQKKISFATLFQSLDPFVKKTLLLPEDATL